MSSMQPTYDRPLNATNEIIKFADDTCLIVPAQASADCHAELDHIRSWAKENNLGLSLDCAKSKEMFLERDNSTTESDWLHWTGAQDNGSRCRRQWPAHFHWPCQQFAVLVFISVVRVASIATSWPPQLVTPRCFYSNSHGKDPVLRTCVVRFQLSYNRPQQSSTADKGIGAVA